MYRILSTIAAVALLVGCSNPLSDNNPITDPIDVGSTEFYITGKVTNNGTPVKGAVARLTKSGLTAITKEDGSYTISGNASTAGLSKSALAKSATRINNENAAADVSVYGDTLVIKVAHPSNPQDSSEITKAAVTSGVIMDLPSTYIVQREIRGYLTAAEEATVSKIEAYVYDNSASDQIKVIDLWHDKVNSAFSSFAYFSSETNKNYTLYVKIYDIENKFIGQSPNFNFPDNAGNIVFKNAFRLTNAKPSIAIDAPATASPKAKLDVKIAAIDSFGQIIKCEVAVNNKNFTDVKSILAKRSASYSNEINETFSVTANETDSILNVYVKVTDDDNNVTYDSSSIKIKNPKMMAFFTVVSAATNDEALFYNGDTVKITLDRFTCDDPTLTITKIEWRSFDTTSSWITSTTSIPQSMKFVVNYDSTFTNMISIIGPQEYMGVDVDGQVPVYEIRDIYATCKITLSNGTEYLNTGRSVMVVVKTLRWIPR